MLKQVGALLTDQPVTMFLNGLPFRLLGYCSLIRRFHRLFPLQQCLDIPFEYSLGLKSGVSPVRPALTIYEERGRQTQDTAEPADDLLFRVYEEWIGNPPSLRERSHDLLPIPVERDAHEFEVATFIPVVQFDQMRDLLTAISAPRSPEVDHKDLAPVRGDIERVCGPDRDVRSGGGRLRRRSGLRGFGAFVTARNEDRDEKAEEADKASHKREAFQKVRGSLFPARPASPEQTINFIRTCERDH